ncbi:MAG TPA: hypothetical protein VF424_07410 [Vicinamibacterales bacterium]
MSAERSLLTIYRMTRSPPAVTERVRHHRDHRGVLSTRVAAKFWIYKPGGAWRVNMVTFNEQLVFE